MTIVPKNCIFEVKSKGVVIDHRVQARKPLKIEMRSRAFNLGHKCRGARDLNARPSFFSFMDLGRRG